MSNLLLMIGILLIVDILCWLRFLVMGFRQKSILIIIIMVDIFGIILYFVKYHH